MGVDGSKLNLILNTRRSIQDFADSIEVMRQIKTRKKKNPNPKKIHSPLLNEHEVTH